VNWQAVIGLSYFILGFFFFGAVLMTVGAIGNPQKIGLLQFDSFRRSDVLDWLTFTSADPSFANRLSQVHVNGGAGTPGVRGGGDPPRRRPRRTASRLSRARCPRLTYSDSGARRAGERVDERGKGDDDRMDRGGHAVARRAAGAGYRREQRAGVPDGGGAGAGREGVAGVTGPPRCFWKWPATRVHSRSVTTGTGTHKTTTVYYGVYVVPFFGGPIGISTSPIAAGDRMIGPQRHQAAVGVPLQRSELRAE